MSTILALDQLGCRSACYKISAEGCGFTGKPEEADYAPKHHEVDGESKRWESITSVKKIQEENSIIQI